MPEPNTGGDCFQAALSALYALADESALICHGRPVNRSPQFSGMRYWHAWVEVQPHGAPWHVIDVSNGLRVGMKRTRYYRLGQIDPEHVARFTLAEAIEAMERFDHYGPWVERWETMTSEPT